MTFPLRPHPSAPSPRRSFPAEAAVRDGGTHSGLRRVRRWLRLGIAGVLLPVGTWCLGASEPVRTLSLPVTAQVDGEGIFLDQVVMVTPTAGVPRVQLAPAPALGQVATLTRAQVQEWIESNVPAFASTNWSGADRVKVSRRTRTLDETELRDLLRDSLQRDQVKDRGELELRLTRPWNPLLVPEESLTVKIVDLPATGVGPNFIVRFELWTGRERLGSWQMAGTAKVWAEIPVARTPLKRGQSLRTDDLSLERRDVISLRGMLARLDGEAADLELQENVNPGQPILARAVRPRPVVRRGRLVDGLVSDGAMTIALKVEVLEDGCPGQLIRVRNPQTRRELMGKVQNEETIVIPW